MEIKIIVISILSIWICYVFLNSLRYKFTGSKETEYIFGKIGKWMDGNFLKVFSKFFEKSGAKLIGSVELIASILFIINLILFHIYSSFLFQLYNLFLFGALISFCIISGAIFFHIFTPLGISVKQDNGKFDNGYLFKLAVSVWFSSLIIIFLIII